jgi:hypothetical protein
MAKPYELTEFGRVLREVLTAHRGAASAAPAQGKAR